MNVGGEFWRRNAKTTLRGMDNGDGDLTEHDGEVDEEED